MQVTLLTVGEYPSASGLHASQVLPFAAHLQRRGVRVNWVAYVPLEMLLRDVVVTRGATLAGIRRLAKEQGVAFTVSLFPVSLIRLYSYVLRDWLVRRAGAKLAGFLAKSGDEEPHIIHCRSYFATAIALEARKRHSHLRVSFDMRSLLPPEIPLMFPRVGGFLYGGLKRWETELLGQADFSFLPSKRGIRRLELEGVTALPRYVPIAGFENRQGAAGASEDAHPPVIGYVGGVGPWHSTRLLERVFDELGRLLPSCNFEVLTTNPEAFRGKVKVCTLSNREIEQAVGTMMAVVVPGTEASHNYFMQNVSTYLFSTKAAEALSLGVPLIVNETIKELADYVRATQCGLVFSEEQGRIRFEVEGGHRVASAEYWGRLRASARQCAGEFKRSAVFEKYLAAWNEPVLGGSGDGSRSDSN